MAGIWCLAPTYHYASPGCVIASSQSPGRALIAAKVLIFCGSIATRTGNIVSHYMRPRADWTLPSG